MVIYLLSKVDYMDDRGWVIAVGARDKKLRDIAELDSRKNECYYRDTEISKYLTKVTCTLELNVFSISLVRMFTTRNMLIHDGFLVTVCETVSAY